MRSWRTRRPLGWAVLATAAALAPLTLLAPETASAQTSPASAPAAAQARELFKKSVAAYRRGDSQEAVDLLTEAYALDPQPVLLYNMARAQEGLGHNDAAIDTYDRYLAAEPNAKDRGAIEQRLVTLRRQRDERVALEKREAERGREQPAEPVAPVVPARQRSVLPYVVAGAGAVGLVTGVVFGLSANATRDDAVAAPTQVGAVEAEDDARGLATLSTVSFVVGGVLLAAGATWWIIDTNAAKKSGASAAPVRVGLGPASLRLEAVLP